MIAKFLLYKTFNNHFKYATNNHINKSYPLTNLIIANRYRS